jgi:hypothetical protein
MAMISAGDQSKAFHHYLEVSSDVHRGDWSFFERNEHRAYRVREPYPGELREPEEKQAFEHEHRIVVVRNCGSDSFERRLFNVDEYDCDYLSALDVFKTNDEEVIGLGLWAISVAREDGFNLYISEVRAIMKALSDLDRSPLWWWRMKQGVEME